MSSRVFNSPISRSFLLHLLLLLLVFFIASHAPKFEGFEPITIDVLDQPEKSAEKYEKKTDANRQVVRPTHGQETKDAKKNSFLSDKTRVVEDERSSALPGMAVPMRRMGENTPTETAKNRGETKTKAVKLSDLGMKLAPKEENAVDQDKKWANTQTGEAIQGGEYIKGMKTGDVSALNTKEFVFYSYFNRMRNQLDQLWPSLLREQYQRIYKTGRKLASNTDYTTRTLVTLNAKGEIEKVQLLEESGTINLDQAALDALNKAGPYPNPPKGLVDESGHVEIQWQFIVKTN